MCSNHKIFTSFYIWVPKSMYIYIYTYAYIYIYELQFHIYIIIYKKIIQETYIFGYHRIGRIGLLHIKGMGLFWILMAFFMAIFGRSPEKPGLPTPRPPEKRRPRGAGRSHRLGCSAPGSTLWSFNILKLVIYTM